MTSSTDYYDLLGVGRDADAAALKAAFRKKAMEYHPDRNGGCEDAMAKFKEVNQAYSVLSDPQKRAAYDRFGEAGVNGMGGMGGGGFGGGPQDINDIFSQVFGDAFGDMFNRAQQTRRTGPQRGSDIRHDLEITMEQAYRGAEVEIDVATAAACDTCSGSGARAGASPQTCSTCQGQGRVRTANGFFQVERTCPSCGGQGRRLAEADVCTSCRGQGQVRKHRTLSLKIPAGVDDGSRIRLTGEGDVGRHGGPRGDLYVFLSVKPHDLFERDGLDLLVQAPVPMALAALGGEIEAPCLASEACDGQCRTTVKVDVGSQTGKTVRVRGKGMPDLQGRRRGDLVVELFVETPTNLTARQKELMRELSETCGDKQQPRHAGFFKKARSFWSGLTEGNA